VATVEKVFALYRETYFDLNVQMRLAMAEEDCCCNIAITRFDLDRKSPRFSVSAMAEITPTDGQQASCAFEGVARRQHAIDL
jgi:hypothetical protein